MAHLPPKIPRCNSNSNSNWPPSPSPSPNPSWVDEFLDFASARRGSHRRSISDSIAFLEQSPDDGFEDDHFISMFAEPTAIEQTGRNEEVESDCLCQWQLQGDSSSDQKVDVDPKRVKRILANRQSAQRSRVRKLQYISELERSVTSLQAQVSVLSPRVAFLDHQRLLLNVDNSALKQRIAALAQDRIFRDAREGALRREIERLRRVYEVKDQSKNMNTERTSAGVGVAEQEQGQEHPHQLLDAST